MCMCNIRLNYTFSVHTKYQYITCIIILLVDILVWTNDNVINWLDSIGMEEFTINLLHSGVHGGLIALDSAFDHERLAMALQIPTSNTAVRE